MDDLVDNTSLLVCGIASGVGLVGALLYAKLWRKKKRELCFATELHFCSGEACKENNWKRNEQAIGIITAYPALVNLTGHQVGLVDYGYTPFLRACWNNNFELIKFMLDMGADVHLKNYDGESALYLVAYRVSKEKESWDPRALNLLLEAGCQINQVNVHGNSALHLASKAGHATLVSWLLVHGADPEIRNRMGYTPSSLALKYGTSHHAEVAALLTVPTRSRSTTCRTPVVVMGEDGNARLKCATL